MRKLLLSLAFCLGLTAPASAEFTLVVPQGPDGGTSVWAEMIAQELEPFLGEPIVLRYIPGARDIPGFNEFHNTLQYNDNTIMVSHGGNGVSFLQESVDYNYSEYESIGMQNLNIIVGRRSDADPDQPRFAAGSGQTPEAYAMTMLICGPDLSVEEYIACFDENVTWVRGMSGGERRLAFTRGELTATRENPVAYQRHVASIPEAEIWFHHGLLDLETGAREDDPNFPGYQFEALFEQRWGVAPSGEFYDAYNLVRSFRDVLQKALWVRAGNPNRDRLVAALTAMINDEAAIARINAAGGDYEWIIGEDGDAVRDQLMGYITEPALRTLVEFNSRALGLDSVYKVDLIQ
jgi:hypothetical protein